MSGDSAATRVAHHYNDGGGTPSFDEWEYGGEWDGRGDLPEFDEFLLQDDGNIPGERAAREERAILTAAPDDMEFTDPGDTEEDRVASLREVDPGEVISFTGHHGDDIIGIHTGVDDDPVIGEEKHTVTPLYRNGEKMTDWRNANDALGVGYRRLRDR